MDINSNLSFKAIYRVQSPTNPKGDKVTTRADRSIINVGLALTKNRESIYSKLETKAIQNFFREAIPDYGKSPKIKFARANGDVFLLTGKDRDDYEKFDKTKTSELYEIRNSRHLSPQKKDEESQNVYNEINAYFDSKEIQSETIRLNSSQMDEFSPISFVERYKIDKFEIDGNDEHDTLSLNLRRI